MRTLAPRIAYSSGMTLLSYLALGAAVGIASPAAAGDALPIDLDVQIQPRVPLPALQDGRLLVTLTNTGTLPVAANLQLIPSGPPYYDSDCLAARPILPLFLPGCPVSRIDSLCFDPFASFQCANTASIPPSGSIQCAFELARTGNVCPPVRLFVVVRGYGYEVGVTRLREIELTFGAPLPAPVPTFSIAGAVLLIALLWVTTVGMGRRR